MFENYLKDTSKVNWFEDGPGSFLDIDLAVVEFDASLKSNLNFRNPDSFKMLVMTSGLEELRAILHYQMMQKQILIVATQSNQLVMDNHMRAFSELNLLKKGLALPNMVVNIKSILIKTGDGFSQEGWQKEKSRFQTNLVNEAAHSFYQALQRKSRLRNPLTKKFNTFLTSVTSTYTKPECCFRVMRSYKIKLLHAYCKEVLKEVYHDAMKVQAVSICQRLRTLSHLFQTEN